MIKGVIFDVGGVLAHDVWESLLPAVVRRYRVRISKETLFRIGTQAWQVHDRRKVVRPGDLERFELEYWRHFMKRVRLPASATPEALMEMSDRFIRAVDGMQPILARLKKKGVGLAICSNNNEFWWPRQYYWLELERWFDPDKVVLSCHEQAAKPDVRMYRAAVRKLALKPSECLFVDDREPNIEPARRYGLAAIHFAGVAALDRSLTKLGL